MKCVDKKEVEIGCIHSTSMYVRRINKEVKEEDQLHLHVCQKEDQDGQ